MATGIYFYYQQGERLRDFPQALGGHLARENVFLYDAFYVAKPRSDFDLEPISVEVLQRAHTPEMIERVRALGGYEGALYSAAGTVSAAIKLAHGELTNAFVFTGYGDHHAGSRFYGGGCYFNGAVIAIRELRERLGLERFAVIDTDAHHGDGTWELCEDDSNVLYLCFCSGGDLEKNHNVNVHVPYRVDDETYLGLVRRASDKWVKAFKPDILFWNWGYDGTMGDYGDLGLTPEVHVLLAAYLKGLADDVCGGRVIVVLCGGSRRDLATALIPRIVGKLAER
jgi:acetoin utilization deacetylase AcuC-like enzyme